MTGEQLFLQQLLNGLTIGAVYALIALGYTMVYGIIQLVNFAHGEIFMIGAYFGLSLFACFAAQAGAAISIGVLALGLIVAAAGSALLGFCIDRSAYRPLRKAPKLSALITAIGVSFVLQNTVMLIYGAQDRYVPSLAAAGSMDWMGVHWTAMQGLIFAVSLFLMIGLQWVVYRTPLGRSMRAVAQDPLAAQLMGISVDRVIAITFLIGSGLAGVGGVLFGVYYSTINFHDGYLTGLKAFTAAVLGGIGNIPGAMVGGLLLGLLEGLGAGYLSSQWKNVIAFGVLVLVLLIRPRGLLGERVGDRA